MLAQSRCSPGSAGENSHERVATFRRAGWMLFLICFDIEVHFICAASRGDTSPGGVIILGRQRCSQQQHQGECPDHGSSVATVYVTWTYIKAYPFRGGWPI